MAKNYPSKFQSGPANPGEKDDRTGGKPCALVPGTRCPAYCCCDSERIRDEIAFAKVIIMAFLKRNVVWIVFAAVVVYFLYLSTGGKLSFPNSTAVIGHPGITNPGG
jgi:hypothetical protein